MAIKRGDIYYADLSPVTGAEEGGMRPVVIISNNKINRYTPTVTVAVIISRTVKPKETSVKISSDMGILSRDSTVLLEQIRTIDTIRLKDYIGYLDDETMQRIDNAIIAALGLTNA